MLRSTSMKRYQRGLSLIELMVGITVGMIVVAGASLMMTSQVSEHRRLTLETQIQQDLRAVADLMVREVRRAGSWSIPQKGIWAPATATLPSGTAMSNPYLSDDEFSVTTVNGNEVLRYSYAKHAERLGTPSPPEDNVVDPGTEQFGFKLDGGTIKFLLGGNWQPMTDRTTLNVTGLRITVNSQENSLADSCENLCDPTSGTCPTQTQRRLNIELSGQSAHDAAVTRVLRLSARLRNDAITGACP